ncbi:MAG: hypothetical protein HGA78_04280 [Nitrospirales bacterium]|nr:hypothetical protein [Nitrospirales bacterium]
MGTVGRIVVTVVGTVIGAFLGNPGLGFALGSMVGGVMFPPPAPSTIAPNQDTPQYITNNGFAHTASSTQLPVPVAFGTVMLPGIIVQGYNLGEGNSRVLAVLALCEHIGNPDPTLVRFCVDGMDFNQLSNYSGSRADDKSWFEFYPAGGVSTIHIQNTGKKGIAVQLENTEEHVSYGIDFLGGGSATIALNHYNDAEGSTQAWTISYRKEGEANFTQVGTYNQYFDKVVQYEVPSGCGSSTKEEKVEGYTRTTHTFTGLPSGVLYWKVSVTCDAHGHILWEYIEAADTGADVEINYPYTTYILFNLVKTDEISSADFKAVVATGRENAADAVEFILSDSELMLGLEGEIDQVSVAEARNFIAVNGRHIGVAFASSNFNAALKLILDATGLLLVRVGGRYKLIPDRDDPPVMSFDTEENIIPGSFDWGMMDYQATCNQLRAKYTDAEDDYAQQDLTVGDPALIERDGYLRESTIDLTPLQQVESAQRRAEEVYKTQLISWWCRFRIGAQDARAEPGDIIDITNLRLGWEAKPFRIIQIDESTEEEGLQGYQVTALEHIPERYIPTYPWTQWTPAPPLSEDGNTLPLEYVYIDTITQQIFNNNQVYTVSLHINYTLPDNPQFDRVELWARKDNETAFTRMADNDSGEIVITALPEVWITWHFKLIPVAANGTKLSATNAPVSSYYPHTAPYSYPGWGGGRWGKQPWGA